VQTQEQTQCKPMSRIQWQLITRSGAQHVGSCTNSAIAYANQQSCPTPTTERQYDRLITCDG
jgi:hypothetical protein